MFSVFSYFSVCSFVFVLSACSPCSPDFCAVFFSCRHGLNISNFLRASEHMLILDFRSYEQAHHSCIYDDQAQHCCIYDASTVLTIAFDAIAAFMMSMWSRELCHTCHTGHTVCTCVHCQCLHIHMSCECADIDMTTQHSHVMWMCRH